MSQITYNDIRLDIVKMNAPYKREAVWSPGKQYLFTRHTLSVRAVCNPGMERTYTYNDGGVLQGGPIDNTLGVTTSDAIREALLTPRKQLIYSINSSGNGQNNQSEDILRSPTDGKIYDASKGPTPISCDVVEIIGARTFLIDFVIQTDIEDSERFDPNTQPAILNNEWTDHEELDQDYFVVRKVTGEAVAHAEELRRRGKVLDGFREEYLPPVPFGFKRESVNVEVSEDGLRARWAVVDRERAIRIIPSYVSRIEAMHTLTYQRGGLDQLLDAGIDALSAKIDSKSRTDRTQRGGTKEITSALKGLMPVLVHGLEIKVWGVPGCFRDQLEEVAGEIIKHRINSFGLPLLNGLAFEVGHDLMGKFTYVNFKQMAGITQTITNLVYAGGDNTKSVFGRNEEVPGWITPNKATQNRGTHYRNNDEFGLVTQDPNEPQSRKWEPKAFTRVDKDTS